MKRRIEGLHEEYRHAFEENKKLNSDNKIYKNKILSLSGTTNTLKLQAEEHKKEDKRLNEYVTN